MNIWFLLWVFIAIFIFGLFFWSLQILFRQKKSWGEVAGKLNLAYDKGRLTSSPSLSGSLKGLPVRVYSEEQTINVNGTKRYRTIIQFQLPIVMNMGGVIASIDARNFANAMILEQTMDLAGTTINPNITIRADNIDSIKNFLSDDKIKSINAVMTINGIACIFIFDDKSTFLRFETPDAFDNTERLERFLLKAAEHAKILSV